MWDGPIAIDLDDTINMFQPAFERYCWMRHGVLPEGPAVLHEHYPLRGVTFPQRIALVDAFIRSSDHLYVPVDDGALPTIRSLATTRRVDLLTDRHPKHCFYTELWLRGHPRPASHTDCLADYVSRVHYTGRFSANSSRPFFTKADFCEKLGIQLLIDENGVGACECASRGIAVFLFDKPWNRIVPDGPLLRRVYGWDEIDERCMGSVLL